MKRSRATPPFFAMILLALAVLGPRQAAALYITGTEDVRGSLFTPAYTDAGITHGPFGLTLSYLRSFDGIRVKTEVQIDFLFDAELEFDELEQASYRASVESNVEQIWNDRFALIDTANDRSFSIEIELTTSGPVFDQVVAVHPDAGRADALNWFVLDTPSVNAHEFGHMLGLFDEYIGGAVDRYPHPTLSDTGLMGLGALTATPEMFPRYYDQYLAYVSELNPDHTFRLTRVPEPSTIVLLLCSSVAALLLVRHVRGRADTTATSRWPTPSIRARSRQAPYDHRCRSSLEQRNDGGEHDLQRSVQETGSGTDAHCHDGGPHNHDEDPGNARRPWRRDPVQRVATTRPGSA